jgi:hypothetical protein
MKKLSANQLAKYMVSSETGKLGIIAEAKSDNTAMAIRYKDAREAIKVFLTDPKRDKNVIYAALGKFEQAVTDPSLSNFVRSDAASSIEALHAFDALSNQIGGNEFFKAPKRQPKITLNGITISVTLDAIIRREYRSESQVGGALFRFTQADDETDAAAAKRRDMSAYAATLVHMQVANSFSDAAKAHHSISYAVDVQFKEAISAPKTYARRVKDMENACRFISAVWDSVE